MPSVGGRSEFMRRSRLPCRMSTNLTIQLRSPGWHGKRTTTRRKSTDTGEERAFCWRGTRKVEDDRAAGGKRKPRTVGDRGWTSAAKLFENPTRTKTTSMPNTYVIPGRDRFPVVTVISWSSGNRGRRVCGYHVPSVRISRMWSYVTVLSSDKRRIQNCVLRKYGRSERYKCIVSVYQRVFIKTF